MNKHITQVGFAKMLASNLHSDQLYGGRSYTYHLQNVVDKVNFLYGESPKLKQLQQVAWMHDLLEDTSATALSLVGDYDFSDEVVNAVVAITKIEGESLSNYYDKVSKNKLAFKVKVADTISNLEHSCRESQTKRIYKYTNQLQCLYKRKEKSNAK